MGRLTVRRARTRSTWLERVTTNHVARLATDQIQYSLMANEDGGVIDDVLVYGSPYGYTLVCNASNRRRSSPSSSGTARGPTRSSIDRTLDTAMIAVQGPGRARHAPAALRRPRWSREVLPLHHGTRRSSAEAVVSRTGYTGEDGFELIVSADRAEAVWTALLDSGADSGIRPCGLGARDTLRFEAAMPLYGHELSETINPYAAGVGWAVKLDKGEFVGREALRRRKTRPRARPGRPPPGRQADRPPGERGPARRASASGP